jgi:rsbT co-antagonist protein RsbR
MNTDSHVDDKLGISELKELYAITDEDVERIRTFGVAIISRLDEFAESFYGWLETQPEFAIFLSDPHVLVRNKRLIAEYWSDFFRCELDANYLANRRRVGETHARIDPPLTTYFAAMNRSFKLLSDLSGLEMKGDDRAEAVSSVTRLIHLDTAVVVETYTEMVAATMASQTQSLIEMSTPVTEIWTGILLLPLVGIIDSKRAQDMMNAILGKIADTQARFFILDISGVAVVDTAVANHLIKITKATALMGCKCTISGVSPAIAQTIVDLGIDVGEIQTTANMRDALSGSFNSMGVRLRGGD